MTNDHRLFYTCFTTSQRLGYGRVSTQDQNLEAQQDALKAAGAHKIFIEKMTGTKASRPELDKLREQMREGDTLVITRLDRLGRSTKDLLSISSELEEKQVELEVIEQNINTKTPEGKLFFTMIAAFSQFEHDLLVARTKDGLAAARLNRNVIGHISSRPFISISEKRILGEQRFSPDIVLGEINPTVFRLRHPPSRYQGLAVTLW